MKAVKAQAQPLAPVSAQCPVFAPNKGPRTERQHSLLQKIPDFQDFYVPSMPSQRSASDLSDPAGSGSSDIITGSSEEKFDEFGNIPNVPGDIYTEQENAPFSMEEFLFKLVISDVRGFLTDSLRDNGEEKTKKHVDLLIRNESGLLQWEHDKRSKKECNIETARKIQVHMSMLSKDLPEISIWPEPLGFYVTGYRLDHIRRYLKAAKLGLTDEEIKETVETIVEKETKRIQRMNKNDRPEKMQNMIKKCVEKQRSDDDHCKVWAIKTLYPKIFGCTQPQLIALIKKNSNVLDKIVFD